MTRTDTAHNATFARRPSGGYFVTIDGRTAGVVEQITWHPRLWVARTATARSGDAPVAEAKTRKAAAAALA